ncbi:NTPase, partial [Reticulomyxa filosa]
MGNQTGNKEIPETARKEGKESDKRKTQDEHEKTDEKVPVYETARVKEKNEKIKKRVYANETSEAEKENKDEELDTTKQKLMQHYQSQDKLAPLFDDPEQSIDTCYVRLALLTQQQFQQQKDKMINNQEKEKKKDYKEENGKWPNSLDYSLIYGNQTENIKLQDIWSDKENESKVRHISIQGEAGSGKSVLSQRIAYLWGNQQMWSHQFQYLLHIPLRNIINPFRHINDNSNDEKKDESNDDIEYLWPMIINALHIPQWNSNDTKCVIHSMNRLLLLLDGFDEIANEIEKNTNLKAWLQHCTSNEYYSIIITSRPNAMCEYLNNPRMLNVIGFQSQDIQNYIIAYFKNNNESDLLMKKLNNNQSLKQDKSSLNNEKWDEMTLSQLYGTLLKSYMKWNWIKSNGLNNKLNDYKILNKFEMEMDYLSEIAWEELKCGQSIISCEIQQR